MREGRYEFRVQRSEGRRRGRAPRREGREELIERLAQGDGPRERRVRLRGTFRRRVREVLPLGGGENACVPAPR